MTQTTEDPYADVIEAAGGLLWRETPTGNELAIIHRAKYDDWTLPKGKREPDESWQETALREVFEETGCKAKLVSFAGSTAYGVCGSAKVVLFWNMVAVEDFGFSPNDEVDQLIWLPFEKVLEVMSYTAEKSLLKKNSKDPTK
jgi:8-oxo-dGTP diphosphatase